MIKVFLPNTPEPLQFEANAWQISQLGALHISRHNKETMQSEELAMFAPGQWRYVKDETEAGK